MGRRHEVVIPDGLTALQNELKLKDIARLIERTARWVSPETFKLLPVWFPEHARGQQLYNAKWSKPRFNKNSATKRISEKFEGNTTANKALCQALGITKKQRPNWSCCHIWGRDDPTFQVRNSVVSDNRFFSCVGNMVLLPTPLKAFTDSLPEMKTMLRICATYLYGWDCDHRDIADVRKLVRTFKRWDCYPKSWPKKGRKCLPLGVMPLNDTIRRRAKKRLDRIAHDLKKAGRYYPRPSVEAAMAYWRIKL